MNLVIVNGSERVVLRDHELPEHLKNQLSAGSATEIYRNFKNEQRESQEQTEKEIETQIEKALSDVMEKLKL